MNVAHVIRASSGFAISRHSLPRFPIVIDATGFVVEPIADFLRSEATKKHLAAGSILDEAYILCAWWNHLSLMKPNAIIEPETLVRWVGVELELSRRSRPGSRSTPRLRRCLDVIFRFHRHVITRIEPVAGGEAWRSGALVHRLDPRLADEAWAKIEFGQAPQRKRGGRPTPSEDQVGAVLDALSGATSSAERNWLIGRWMRDVGLRRMGVAALTVATLEKAMSEDGLLRQGEELSYSGTTQRSRMDVRSSLQRFAATGRSYVVGEICEKGGRTRSIPIPIELLQLTLTYLWSSSRGRRQVRLSGPLWLSRKTGRGLTAGAVGDIVKRAFTAAEVAGSGHRLRACFAEEVVFNLYADQKARHGILLDENQILMTAAEIMGHARLESLRPYLNRAARNFAEGNRVRLHSA